MNSFIFILYLCIVITIPYFIIRYCMKNLQKTTNRTVVIILSVVTGLVAAGILYINKKIPGITESLITKGITITEQKLNEISPDYTEQVLEKDKIETFLSDKKQFELNLKSYTDDVNFLIRIWGVDIFITLLEEFNSQLDTHMKEFSSLEIPFTLHNIFIYIKEKTSITISNACAKAGNIIMIITLIAYLLVWIMAYATLKGWVSDNGKSIVYGEAANTDSADKQVK